MAQPHPPNTAYTSLYSISTEPNNTRNINTILLTCFRSGEEPTMNKKTRAVWFLSLHISVLRKTTYKDTQYSPNVLAGLREAAWV